MRIVTLSLQNFRSHQETVLELDRFNVTKVSLFSKSHVQLVVPVESVLVVVLPFAS